MGKCATIAVRKQDGFICETHRKILNKEHSIIVQSHNQLTRKFESSITFILFFFVISKLMF